MPENLKKLVGELEIALVQQRGSLLDAPALEALQARINRLKKAIDEAKTEEQVRWLRTDVLNSAGSLLSIIIDIKSLLETLWK